ncbi:hypothetical protein [Nitrosococcus watsonii]|uniref:Uncharacterized protein n=1 Tax=Nitrosococcus watsoni (strain C-113) TaxID=105559 RepID=D8K6E5_NITWC|nr:hypothetical protein [Nitrosococcus watsonii]ADJ28472.1 conserved hypothetical protein [Nitrosococcus watsonii C-113]
MTTQYIHIVIVPMRVAATLSIILLALLIAHVIGLVLAYGFGHSYVFGLVPLFNIAREGNIPTFFASSLLLFNGLLFLLLWRLSNREKKEKKIWLLLSLTFSFLAVDEFAMIHELLISPVRETLNVGGLLFFAWVIPYTFIVIALGFIVAPFIWRLGARYRVLFGSSAAAYLSGAIFVEMLGGKYYQSLNETVNLNYRLFQTVEELLEFTGLILLVYTLLELIRTRAPVTQIKIKCQPHAGNRASE